MPRCAANLSMPYAEHAFPDRFEAAAADGFDAVEFMFPCAHSRDAITQRPAAHAATTSAGLRWPRDFKNLNGDT